ncbi:hypothetical protein JXC34_06320 [Candidatus Woesearchaeota archaeon]|nr:hypothetical protein [Candidatus Woesearchaeota archaeon]
MKKRCRAQIAMEYILIASLSLMILLGGAYFFRNYALESNDMVLQKRLGDVSNQILTKARKIYYYGPPSKSVLNVEMPPQIDSMFVLTTASQDEYHLGFRVLTSAGPKEFIFESDVPLEIEETIDCTTVGSPDYCSQGICGCTIERYYSAGIKNLKVEASDSCSMGSCIIIGEISPLIE